MKATIHIVEFDDYIDTLRKTKGDPVYFFVEVNQQELKKPDGGILRRIIGSCRFTCLVGEMLYTHVSNVIDIDANDAGEVAKVGESIKENTDNLLKLFQRNYAGCKLVKGVVG